MYLLPTEGGWIYPSRYSELHFEGVPDVSLEGELEKSNNLLQGPIY